MDSVTGRQSHPLCSLQLTGPFAPPGVHDEQHPSAFGFSVSYPPPYTANAEEEFPPPSLMTSGHCVFCPPRPPNAPSLPTAPPPYQLIDGQEGGAQEAADSSLYMRCIKKAVSATLMTMAGIGGFLLAITLSPVIGLYSLVHSCINGSLCRDIDEDDALIIICLSIAAAPVIACSAIIFSAIPVIAYSPIAGMDCAFRAGRAYCGEEEFRAPHILAWSHKFMSRVWLDLTTCNTTPDPAVIHDETFPSPELIRERAQCLIRERNLPSPAWRQLEYFIRLLVLCRVGNG